MLGADFAGIAPRGHHRVVVVGVRMLDEVVDGAPSKEYYELVVSESRRLDEIACGVAGFLVKGGYSARVIPASIESGFSHKHAGAACGLGFIGKSGLLLTVFGPRVRLASVCTDAPLVVDDAVGGVTGCVECGACVARCPVGAIRDSSFDADACAWYNNRVLAQGGRYGACGICVRVCPAVQVQRGSHA